MPRARQTVQQQAAARAPTSGRQYHIRTLLRIFHIAGANWDHVGRFLVSLFQPNGLCSLTNISHCRHHAGNATSNCFVRRHQANPQWNGPTVAEVECQSAGGADYDNPSGEGRQQYVAFNHLCNAAKNWCQANIRDATPNFTPEIVRELGDEIHRFDNEPEIPSSPPAPEIFSSQTRNVPVERTTGVPPSGRGLIKIRVPVLAVMRVSYSVGGPNGIGGLEECVYQLCNDPAIQVLHMCGCGLGGPVNSARRNACCRPEHLRLGTARLNRLHAHWHECLKVLAAVNDWRGYFGLIHALNTTYSAEFSVDDCNVF